LRDSAMLETLYSCGLRVSELTALRMSDLFFGEGYIRVIGKGDKQRLVPVSTMARDRIQLYLEHRHPYRANEDTVFLNNRGRRLTRVMVFTVIKQAAARAGIDENMYPWDGDLTMSDDKGCFYANFKPMEGNYVKDGHIITSRVGTYAPNDFGLYDMAGNVSEWTSTAFTESVGRLTNDLNPEYRYDAAKEDPYKMKRKIVRGGSWKDVAHNIRSDIRMWEFQNEQRSYIGFRCVRSQIGFARGQQLKNKNK